jgi:hypothetical protein
MNAEVFQFVERARAITFVNQALAPIRKPAISFLSAWPSIPQDSDCDHVQPGESGAGIRLGLRSDRLFDRIWP